MFGGYLQQIVVNECYVLWIIYFEVQLVVVVLLLCVGIMIYLLLCYWYVGLGKKVGVVGIGGFGYMGIKLVYVMGVYVVVFIIFEFKCNVVRVLGVDDVVVLCNEDEMVVYVKSFDFIFNIVVVLYNFDVFIMLLKCDGIMMLVGVLVMLYLLLEVFNLIFCCWLIVGLMIGGILEIQEMFDFCVEYGIVVDIELICGDEINEVWERMVKGDVKYCFVIDSVIFVG